VRVVTGVDSPSVVLDLLYLMLEHVLVVLEGVEGEHGIEVIVVLARDLQQALGDYWRGRHGGVEDELLPF